MARRKDFKTDEKYLRYKKKEYDRYYGSTQLYPPRKWDDDETDLLIQLYDHRVMELSVLLQRSVKSIEHKKKTLRDKGLIT